MLGGRAKGCSIELHDVVFATGESIEDTYPKLVTKWFGGIRKGLHVDSSLELDCVDSYKISLSNEPPLDSDEALNLYFVNFGGYKDNVFGEFHDIKFYVGARKKDIVKKAKLDLCVGMIQQHCDDNMILGDKDIDDVMKVACVDGLYIHLEPTTEESNQTIDSFYRKLDVASIVVE